MCYAAALPAIYCLHVVVGLHHADSLSVLQRAGAFSQLGRYREDAELRTFECEACGQQTELIVLR